jgi:hypothetical protein
MYVIQREFDELPWDNADFEIEIENKTYDVVVLPKNFGLDSVSDYIIDDNNTFVKRPIGESDSTLAIEAFEKKIGEKFHDLLLG